METCIHITLAFGAIVLPLVCAYLVVDYQVRRCAVPRKPQDER